MPFILSLFWKRPFGRSKKVRTGKPVCLSLAGEIQDNMKKSACILSLKLVQRLIKQKESKKLSNIRKIFIKFGRD
jgi:hypothetical protein